MFTEAAVITISGLLLIAGSLIGAMYFIGIVG
jgi:hypothetical protein